MATSTTLTRPPLPVGTNYLARVRVDPTEEYTEAEGTDRGHEVPSFPFVGADSTTRTRRSNVRTASEKK
jgi:hypothetical protein